MIVLLKCCVNSTYQNSIYPKNKQVSTSKTIPIYINTMHIHTQPTLHINKQQQQKQQHQKSSIYTTCILNLYPAPSVTKYILIQVIFQISPRVQAATLVLHKSSSLPDVLLCGGRGSVNRKRVKARNLAMYLIYLRVKAVARGL